MVELNISIGQSLKQVECCGINPHVMEYTENLRAVKILYTCPRCGSVGAWCMAIPQEIRDKQLKAFRDAEKLR